MEGLSANSRKHSASWFLTWPALPNLSDRSHGELVSADTNFHSAHNRASSPENKVTSCSILFGTLKVTPGHRWINGAKRKTRLTLRWTFPLKGHSTCVKIFWCFVQFYSRGNVVTSLQSQARNTNSPSGERGVVFQLRVNKSDLSLILSRQFVESFFCWPSLSLPNKFG